MNDLYAAAARLPDSDPPRRTEVGLVAKTAHGEARKDVKVVACAVAVDHGAAVEAADLDDEGQPAHETLPPARAAPEHSSLKRRSHARDGGACCVGQGGMLVRLVQGVVSLRSRLPRLRGAPGLFKANGHLVKGGGARHPGRRGLKLQTTGRGPADPARLEVHIHRGAAKALGAKRGHRGALS